MSMMLVDQTLYEAIRLGMDKKKLYAICSAISQYTPCFDVVVKDWVTVFEQNEPILAQCLLRGWIEPDIDGIRQAVQYGFGQVCIRIEDDFDSDAENGLRRALGCVRDKGLAISLYFAGDFKQIDDALLKRLSLIIDDFSVQSMVIVDRKSLLQPFSVFDLLQYFGQNISCALEFHAHNLFGLATANVLAAFRAGIQKVAVSVGGVGGNGHAALEEILLARKHLFAETILSTGDLAAFCEKIFACMGLSLPAHKAIVGRDIFAHESGIHVDGVMKNSSLYEVFSPEEVGLSRQLIVGKHSGSAILKRKFLEWNISLDDDEAQSLLKKVRKMAIHKKGSLSDDELRALYCGQKIGV